MRAMRRSSDHTDLRRGEQHEYECDQVADVRAETTRLQTPRMPGRNQRRAHGGHVQPLVDQLGDAAAVGNLLHDAALRVNGDLSLRAEHSLEHQSEWFREPCTRPAKRRLVELP